MIPHRRGFVKGFFRILCNMFSKGRDMGAGYVKNSKSFSKNDKKNIDIVGGRKFDNKI